MPVTSDRASLSFRAAAVGGSPELTLIPHPLLEPRKHNAISGHAAGDNVEALVRQRLAQQLREAQRVRVRVEPEVVVARCERVAEAQDAQRPLCCRSGHRGGHGTRRVGWTRCLWVHWLAGWLAKRVQQERDGLVDEARENTARSEGGGWLCGWFKVMNVVCSVINYVV